MYTTVAVRFLAVVLLVGLGAFALALRGADGDGSAEGDETTGTAGNGDAPVA